jgi:hypothetical protein
MAQVTVQTTMFQHPITVDEDEVPILRAQGLLSEAARQPAEGERRYPITEVPDQTPGGEQPDTAGAKPGSEEKTK